MEEGATRFCDVALPVPVDRLFTYRVSGSATANVAPGCRVWVPFASRRLTGVALAVHTDEPEYETREVLKVLDETPVLDAEAIELARWIATYYCAPLGEVLKGMLPLSGELRRDTRYTLTALGRDISRQLSIGGGGSVDAATTVLTMLAGREHTAESLKGKVPGAERVLKRLLSRGWVAAEEVQEERDPLRSKSERLAAEFTGRPDASEKLNKSERELLAYLELHPGLHNLAELGRAVKRASEAARGLARRQLIRLELEDVALPGGYERPVPVLNAHQQTASDAIGAAITDRSYAAFLLQGVTGSGKTEVYLRAIEKCLAEGRSALLLVPEIALTPAVAGQFFHRFGKQVAILHSAFGDAERANQWRRIRGGQARVIVGTRSGVFAPVKDLGLIIVDEEHDGSYKQGETPRYHGRDVALVRAQRSNAVAVLGSATPSIESRANADAGKYRMLRLPERIAQRPMPRVEIVDMRVEFLETKKQVTFSRKLLEALRDRLARGEQAMLLLNRRGFSSFMVCRACGERMQCANCSVVLTHHRRDRRMLCHYCGFAEKIPAACPKCGSEHIQFLGTGSERVEDELHAYLPEARVARLDRDSASGKGAFEQILQSFRAGDVDILVGTQMIAKGHDIPNVTLVGVVLADIGLSMPDFRAAERSFQLLTQAAGRAGRGEMPGQVIVQTLNPEHYAVKLAAEQDYENFYKKELEFRKWLRYPPFAAFANVMVRATSQEEALRLSTELSYVFMPPPAGVRVMGPAEATVLRVKNEFRYQILVKAAKRTVLRDVVNRLRSYVEEQNWPATALMVDIDPVNLM